MTTSAACLDTESYGPLPGTFDLPQQATAPGEFGTNAGPNRTAHYARSTHARSTQHASQMNDNKVSTTTTKMLAATCKNA